jgi:hypothetical protein
MEIETLADVKLVSRALSEGWLNNAHEKRARAVDALFEIVADHFDPEVKIKAFEALAKADVIDLKRVEVALKQQEADDQRKLRLLELVNSLPAGEVARITQEHREAAEG